MGGGSGHLNTTGPELQGLRVTAAVSHLLRVLRDKTRSSYFICIGILPVCKSALSVCSVHGGQKRASNLLELELVLNSCLGARIKPSPLQKSRQFFLNC